MTALGARNPLPCQTIPVLPTVLALLAHSDILTISSVWKLEQLFFIMRIAGTVSQINQSAKLRLGLGECSQLISSEAEDVS